MTETANDTTVDDDAEVEALAADETALGTSQAAHLTHVQGLTEDQRQGIWGQDIN